MTGHVHDDGHQPRSANQMIRSTPPAPATNMVVSDPLPSGLDFVRFASNPGGDLQLPRRSRTIRCDVGTVAVGGTFTYAYAGDRRTPRRRANDLGHLSTHRLLRTPTPRTHWTQFTGCDAATSWFRPPHPRPVDLGVVKTVSAHTSQPGRPTLTWHARRHQPRAGDLDQLHARRRVAARRHVRQCDREPAADLHDACRRGRRRR